MIKYFDEPVTLFMLLIILFLVVGTAYGGYMSLFNECTIEARQCQSKCFKEMSSGLRTETVDYDNPHKFMQKCQDDCRTCK